MDKINDVKQYIISYKKDKEYSIPNCELKEMDISTLKGITPIERELLDKKLKEYEEILFSHYFSSIQSCLNLNELYGICNFQNTINLLSLSLHDTILDPRKMEYMDYITAFIIKQIKQYSEINEFGIVDLKVFSKSSKVLGEYYTFVKEDFSKMYHKNPDSKVMTYTLWTSMDARKILK